MSYLFIIIIVALIIPILYRFEERIFSKYKRKIAYGRNLDDLVFNKYAIKRKGFGPWFLYFKESDHSLRMRAIHVHAWRLFCARIGDSEFEILPKWL